MDSAGTIGGLGFSPLDYVEMWAAAGRTNSNGAAAGAASSRTSTTAASPAATNSGAAAQSSSSSRFETTSSLASSTQDVSAQVALEIARLKSAAEQVLRIRAAQLAAGHGYVSAGGSYAYTIGPDGQLYTTGAIVSYDTTPVPNNPQATIQKMQQVRAAALASSSPGAADFAAAATATQLEMQARLEIARKLAEQYLGADSAGTQAGSLLAAMA